MPEQPSAAPPRAPNRLSAFVAIVGIACAGICAPLVSSFESGGQQHLAAYHGVLDPLGVYTICDGDTLGVHAGDRETAAGCAIRLDRRLADFARPVLKVNPGLYGHPNQLAAAISLTYNIGAANYASTLAPACPPPKGKPCSSSGVARKFAAHQWRAACDGFLAWNRASGKVAQGLVNRRAAERALCLKEIPA